ncbi:MAG: hypothetical protein IJU45_07340 [Clostridia bacterium]|nr:hypothetical protein [Clostridia bacterium]
MNTIFYHPEIRGLLSLWLLFICLALVWAIMQLWQQKRYKPLVPTLMFFAVCDIYWQYLNAYSFYIGGNKEYYKIDYAPIWLIVIINAVLSVLVTGYVYHIYRYKREHISAVSVKESFDTLPSGVCFYEDDGRVYLVNDAMDKLTQSLVGQHLYNGARLWQIVKSRSMPLSKENRAIVEIGSKTYGFSRHENEVNAQKLYELIAVDITEEAEQNRQLERKNAALEQLNRVLDEYNANLADIVREREIVQSKTKIHDDMNVLLISTMNSIENYSRAASEQIVKMWNSNIIELQKDTAPYRKNPLETLENLAESLGIMLEFSGEFPGENDNLRLLMAAVSECMTNAIRHAGAKTLYVQSDKSGFVISNDGNPPEKEITEGGGLSNLRRRANKADSELIIRSKPEFSLTVKYKEVE